MYSSPTALHSCRASKSINHCNFLIVICLLCSLSIVYQKAYGQQLFDYSSLEISYSHQVFEIDDDLIGLRYVADLNGDGATDIIMTGANYPFLGLGPGNPKPGLILFNNGDNSFSIAEGDAAISEHARDFHVEDFDGDEILDIYIADHGYDADPFPGYKNQLLLGTGTGFIDATDRLPGISGFTHNAAVGDIDDSKALKRIVWSLKN